MTVVFMEDLACVLGLDVVIVISGNSWGLPQSFFGGWLWFLHAGTYQKLTEVIV